MRPTTCFSMFMCLLSFFSLLQLIVPFSAKQPLCHGGDHSALLQFKESFIINTYASPDPGAYPKVAFWKLEGNVSNCCEWDGVECDESTGHVIGLDLSSSCLYGSINSSSSLFRLVHLQKLNLALNDFNYSPISPKFGNFSMLTYLNLSDSLFSGHVPLEISKLSKLTSLDLSFNYDVTYLGLLKLEGFSLNSFVQNITKLEDLRLSYVGISSPIHDTLGNVSSLKILYLGACGLNGKFPDVIFKLPNLQHLVLPHNPYLSGHLPEFQESSHLKSLRLRNTSFSGQLPATIGNLHALVFIDLRNCKFSGMLPSSLGNLSNLLSLDFQLNAFSGQIPVSFANLTQIKSIALFYNNFSASGTLSWLEKLTKLEQLCLQKTNLSGEIPSSLGKLTLLSDLDLGANHYVGEIPYFLANLTQLSYLEISGNQLSGQLPPWLVNLTQLQYIHLGANKLHGSIPISISRLQNLKYLNLYANDLNGSVELDAFLMLKNLTSLNLARNRLSVLTKPKTNTTLPEFVSLGLSSCNLNEFPNFLRSQNQLQYLDLSSNNLNGPIPRWVWNMSIETLMYLDLSYNLLKEFVQPGVVLPWPNLVFLNLSSNLLQGSLPVPASSVLFYAISNNSLTGEIPASICRLNSLHVLDFSKNNLSGQIPQCLGNFSNSLSVLNLHSNSFSGTIPQNWTTGSKLRTISLGQNQLHGGIPRSLAACRTLESLDLGNNNLNDTFPFWLGNLSCLKVLSLRANHIHGTIGRCKSDSFPKLRIIDLSDNDLTGELPSECFLSWNAMKITALDHLAYMQADTKVPVDVGGFTLDGNFVLPDHYDYSMTLTSKGLDMEYPKIIEILTAILLSCNKFEGEIPEVIGNLNGLRSLNFSDNFLSGHIPSSIGKLTQLESLDLSQNKLSGEIPQQLVQLTALAKFDVSNNLLGGRIPQGNQFDNLENNSFDGNAALCGKPLSIQCEKHYEPLPSSPPSFEENKDSASLFEFYWKIVVIGYGCGLVFGLVMGHIVTSRKQDWFWKTFRIKKQRAQRHRRRGHGDN